MRGSQHWELVPRGRTLKCFQPQRESQQLFRGQIEREQDKGQRDEGGD